MDRSDPRPTWRRLVPLMLDLAILVMLVIMIVSNHRVASDVEEVSDMYEFVEAHCGVYHSARLNADSVVIMRRCQVADSLPAAWGPDAD